MSQAEVQRLKERIEELEFLLGKDRKLTERLRVSFDLEPIQAEAMALLMGRIVASQEAVFAILYGALPECDQPEAESLNVLFFRLRRKLSPYGINIVTHTHIGWSMPKESKDRAKRLMAELEAA